MPNASKTPRQQQGYADRTHAQMVGSRQPLMHLFPAVTASTETCVCRDAGQGLTDSAQMCLWERLEEEHGTERWRGPSWVRDQQLWGQWESPGLRDSWSSLWQRWQVGACFVPSRRMGACGDPGCVFPILWAPQLWGIHMPHSLSSLGPLHPLGEGSNLSVQNPRDILLIEPLDLPHLW